MADHFDIALAERGSTETEHVAPRPAPRAGVVGWRWYYRIEPYPCSRGCGRGAFVAVEHWNEGAGEMCAETRPDGWICTGETYGTIVCPRCQAEA